MLQYFNTVRVYWYRTPGIKKNLLILTGFPKLYTSLCKYFWCGMGVYYLRFRELLCLLGWGKSMRHGKILRFLNEIELLINPNPRPYLRVLCIRTLLYPGWCGRQLQVWRVYPDEGRYDTGWLTGLWSIQAKVEGIVPKAAWHWGRDSSVVNDPLGEPGRTRGRWPYVLHQFVWRLIFGGAPADINE